MPSSYKIDKENRLVISTGSGVLTLADSLSHQERLLKDADFDPSFSQLLDFTQVTDVELSSEEIHRLARTTVFSSNSRRAFLVDTDLKFGLARLFAIMRESFGEKGIRVFRNFDDALDWALGRSRE